MADNITIKTKGSPRFEGDTLKWFAGNTFPYTLHISLVNGDTGEYIAVNPEHRIEVAFYLKKEVAHNFVFTKLVVEDVDGVPTTVITLDFNDEISAKFGVGSYTYCITYYGEYVTTIADNMKAEVEKCH